MESLGSLAPLDSLGSTIFVAILLDMAMGSLMAPLVSNRMANDYARKFINFVNKSPSPFHAVEETRQQLLSLGFTEVHERQAHWDIYPLGKYFFTRNKSSIVAFAVGGKYETGNGCGIIVAHTDSPCLKVKPNSNIEKAGYIQLGCETYGGGLWHTWFDRDLSVAGRAILSSNNGYEHRLVHIMEPFLRIPTLAIHLDRSVNQDGFKFNNETHLLPVLSLIKTELSKSKDEKFSHPPLLMTRLSEELNCNPRDIVDFELCLYDTQLATIGGISQEFIFSSRLDNLMMSYCASVAFAESLTSLEHDSTIRLLALFDNEEVGSETMQGAMSPLLEDTLTRITNHKTCFESTIQKSFLISADMAHAIHPNYQEKHEERHRPSFNGGLVVKENVNQRYATNSITRSLMRELSKKHSIPLQDFVVRNDSPCGTTLGPILAGKLGLRTVDVGIPQLSMHSIREMCAIQDVEYAIKVFKAFFDEYYLFEDKLSFD